MKRKGNDLFFKIIITLGMIALISNIIILVSKIDTSSKFEEITDEQALKMINEDEVEKVGLSSENEYIINSSDGTYLLSSRNGKEFERTLFSKNILFENNQRVVEKVSFLRIALIVVVVNVILFFLIMTFSARKINKMDPLDIKKLQEQIGESSFSGPMSLRINKKVPDITFDNVEGIEEVKREAKNLVKYLKNPYKYKLMGARMPKGIILYGPPGTGKTLIAKAIAGSAGVPFLAVSGSDFMEMYVGVGAKRVKQLFAEANKMAPCIVFIDEIDGIGAKRGQSQSGERDQTINAILTEMDGFNSNNGVMVIAATNRLDILDPAILRAGRFDKHIAVSLPNKEERLAILKLHAQNKKFDESVDLEVIASQTTGFSGADLESLLNESTLIAVNEEKNFVSSKQIDRAFFKIIMEGDVREGQEKRGSKELKLVAWHEAGHALITKLLTKDEVSKVTILASTSGAGGVTFHNPPEGSFFSKDDLKNRIAIAYGGRAAEEILFGDHDHVTVGASSDIQEASKQIKDYIMKYGMSDKFGMLDIGVFEYQSMSNDEVIKEASSLSNEIYKYTLEVLLQNKVYLEEIANELLKKETLLDSDINKILGREEIVEEVENIEMDSNLEIELQ